MKLSKKKCVRSLLKVCAIFVYLSFLYRVSITFRAVTRYNYNGKHVVVNSDDSRRRSNARSDDGLITCNRNSQAPREQKRRKKANKVLAAKELVTIPEFYEKKSKCSHNFRNTTTFFHVGKAGGGTVSTELGKNRIGISWSHPRPNKARVKELQNGPATTLIINVRDPIDRFVSAFRWRLAVLCSPNDEREATEKGAAHHPHDQCKTSESMQKEEQMLRETYKSDPNVLSEALCEESPLRQKAIEDYSMIGHSLTLVEWLEFLIGPSMIDKISDSGIQNFIALPLEKQVDADETLFEQHIQHLGLHLLQTRYHREKAKQIIDQNPHEGEAKGKEMREHSSVRYYNSTNTTAPPAALSPLGECCLARHLQKDYSLIQTMLGDDAKTRKLRVVEPLVDAHPVIGKACLWGSKEQQKLCRSDLRSMLNRHAQYLNMSLGTCSKVVSNNA